LARTGIGNGFFIANFERGKRGILRESAPHALRGDALFAEYSLLAEAAQAVSLRRPRARFRTTRENLPEALRLVAHVLKQPTFPAGEFEQARRRVIAALQRRAKDGLSYGVNTQLAISWTDKLNRGRTFAETGAYEAKLRALTREDVGAALKKHLDPSKISTVKAGGFARRSST
jgi:predicted Zn-dependent peptidase